MRRKRGAKYSPSEDSSIIEGIGTRGWEWFHREVPGRTMEGIRSRASEIANTRSLTRGALSLRRLAASTGYSRCQLRRAQAALGQKWRRVGPKGDFIISEEQAEDLCAWLEHDYWAPACRRYNCVWCTTDTQPPYAIGLCRSCYYRYRRVVKSLRLPSTLDEQRELVKDLRCGEVLEHEEKFLQAIAAWLATGAALPLSGLIGLARVCEEGSDDETRGEP